MLAKTVTAFVVISLALAAGAPLDAHASRRQGRRPERKSDAREAGRPAAPVPGPQEAASGAYLTGEAKLTVRGAEHPVVRIGMAPSGVTVVEFPAADEFFAVHPPENGDWVEVEKSPSLKTDHHLVLRAGKDLAGTSGPAASVSVQMKSGLVVTIWAYPVEFITRQTHRCVISYDRAEVVAARKRAGLAVNLGGAERSDPTQATAAAAEGAKPPVPIPAPAAGRADQPTAPPAPVAPLPSPAIAEVKESEKKTPAGDDDGRAARSMLARAAAEPKRFKQWTGPLHGLSVSTRSADLDGRRRIALVAVRNVSSDPVRVLPDHPALSVETLDDKGRAFEIGPLEKLHIDSTTAGGVIPAGATVYYAVVYAAPALGARQRLRVAVGQTEAADEPAAAILAADK